MFCFPGAGLPCTNVWPGVCPSGPGHPFLSDPGTPYTQSYTVVSGTSLPQACGLTSHDSSFSGLLNKEARYGRDLHPGGWDGSPAWCGRRAPSHPQA